MAYCIRNREEYNMVLIHPDGRDGSAPAVESWTAEGSVEDMRRDFNGWEPRYGASLLPCLGNLC
jgi:salicylate hydroxylase